MAKQVLRHWSQVVRHSHAFLFKHFVELAIVIASTNAIFNPLIYVQCSIEFRKIVKKIGANLRQKMMTAI